MAEEFNRYFTSVFTKENTAEIPSAAPLFQSSEYEKLCDIYIDGSLVRNKLDRLRTDKAPGADSLLTRVLKELKNEMTVPLMLIMQSSFESGVVPDDWKAANVIPIHKSGSRSNTSNTVLQTIVQLA